MGQKRQWYYRGSLSSCNYSCSYCPFCKKRHSSKEEETDREQLFRFVKRLEEMEDLQGAVQIVPYGEALLHSYYWEGLARLSRHPGIDAVGAQSNFSFPVEHMLKIYTAHGGKIEKLRLWGTFHPEMTTIEAFISQCKSLSEWKVLYCAGAVGVPSQIPEIQKLREKLSSSVYLWINKMNGLRRNYTEEEKKLLLHIDEFFDLELKHYPAEENLCGNQIFVEADGSLKRCNLCQSDGSNLYDVKPKQPGSNAFSLQPDGQLPCTRRECSCYLAYNNRSEADQMLFQPYPAFRIPVYPRAVFLDIDGTILPKGQRKISEDMKERLLKLSEHSFLYLATSLPPEEALKKVQGLYPVLAGGVFASGGRCVIFNGGTRKNLYDTVYSIEADWLKEAEKKQKEYGFRIHIYHREKQVYKVTMTIPAKKLPDMELRKEFAEKLVQAVGMPETCRWFLEENCIEIVRGDRGKLKGILEIMQEMGYQKEEVMVWGDSAEDEEMLGYFSWSVQVS